MDTERAVTASESVSPPPILRQSSAAGRRKKFKKKERKKLWDRSGAAPLWTPYARPRGQPPIADVGSPDDACTANRPPSLAVVAGRQLSFFKPSPLAPYASVSSRQICEGPEPDKLTYGHHLKLAVDRSPNHVMFADAGSEFVDILLGFLMLPLSAVQCIADLSPQGCLTNLSRSVNYLRNSELLKVDMCHGIHLTPVHNDVLKEVCNIQTFLRSKERFVISDEWTIKPASTRSILSLPQTFGTDGTVHRFEEVEVRVGSAEVASLLKASVSSNTVLTDAFLSKGTDVQSARLTVNQSSIHKQYNKDSSSYPEIKFLDLPVGCVMKSGGAGTSHLSRSFNNLYRSTIDLNAAGFLTGSFLKETLLDPSLSPFDILSNNMCRSTDCRCGKDRVPDVNFGACHRELVEDRKYVVGDDLVIHQASAMSVMKHWRERNKAMVLEMDITIGKQEAVALLRAMLASKTALTDVFISRLDEQSSLQNIQIFAKIPKGTTIILEVARSDTIATVKSKIKDKVSIPAGCRHELVYGSRYLRDSCTVAEYNLVRDCTVVCNFFKRKII